MIYPNLYVERKKRKETAKSVAGLLNITRQAYALKESGERQFTLKEARKIAERYEKTIDYLFKESS